MGANFSQHGFSLARFLPWWAVGLGDDSHVKFLRRNLFQRPRISCKTGRFGKPYFLMYFYLYFLGLILVRSPGARTLGRFFLSGGLNFLLQWASSVGPSVAWWCCVSLCWRNHNHLYSILSYLQLSSVMSVMWPAEPHLHGLVIQVQWGTISFN